MGEQQNAQLVQGFYTAFKQGNVTGVLSTLADDVHWFIVGPKEIIPFVGQRQGHDQVAQFFSAFAKMQEVEELEVREIVAQADRVVALGHYSWRVKSTGRSYASEWAHAFTVRDNKISNFREYLDTYAWAAAYRTAQSAVVGK